MSLHFFHLYTTSFCIFRLTAWNTSLWVFYTSLKNEEKDSPDALHHSLHHGRHLIHVSTKVHALRTYEQQLFRLRQTFSVKVISRKLVTMVFSWAFSRSLSVSTKRVFTSCSEPTPEPVVALNSEISSPTKARHDSSPSYNRFLSRTWRALLKNGYIDHPRHRPQLYIFGWTTPGNGCASRTSFKIHTK